MDLEAWEARTLEKFDDKSKVETHYNRLNKKMRSLRRKYHP